jgi:CRP/FNR family cyclic AMP-dependent transcriptional regulator
MKNITIDEARDYLKRHGWLAHAPASFTEQLLRRCEIESVDRGVCPYRMGEPPDGLRGIVTGGFAFEIAIHERGPHLAHIFRPGFWFGELELFAGIPKISSITATRPSIILHLDQASFEDLVSVEPESWRWVGLLASQHTELALRVIDDASLRDPAQRIVALLLRLAGVRNSDNLNDPQPELDITQDDLAHLATVSRSTVVAHLQALESAGLIARDYGRLTLLDPGGIRQRLADRSAG